jgi:TonB-linked SusC/RagA family outer membrane protein
VTRLFLILAFAGQFFTGNAQTQLITEDFDPQPLPQILHSLMRTHLWWRFDDGGLDILFDSVSLHVNGATPDQTLKALFKGLPITYTLEYVHGFTLINVKPLPRWTLSGMVSDQSGEPLAGLTVSLLHTDSNTITDGNGRFQLNKAWDSAALYIQGVTVFDTLVNVTGRYVHFVVRTRVTYLPRVTVNARLSNGMQHQNAMNYPGNYHHLEDSSLHRGVYTNVLQQLPGQIPGLLTDPAAGNPLGFIIHGRNTLYANSTPTILMDDFIYSANPADINPNDIRSITTLKDPAAASIWGPFSTNGVLVMTTRSSNYNDSLRMAFTVNYTGMGKPDLFYPPQMNRKSYIGMEGTLFQQGWYDQLLLNPNYPAVTPVVSLLSQERNGTLTPSYVNTQINYLGSFDTRRGLLNDFYRNSVNQQYHFSVSGGNRQQHYYLSAGYDHNPTDLVRDKYERYTLHFAGSRQLVPNVLELSGMLQFTATNTLDNNPGTLPIAYSYGPLVDSRGNPAAVNYKYNPGYIDTAGGGQLLDWHFRPVQELYLANDPSHRLAGFAQLKLVWHLSASLAGVVSYRYSQSAAWTRDLFNQNTFYARDLINQFSEISGQSITYPVPLGDMLHKSDTGFRAHNLRAQLNYSHLFGKSNRVIGMIGAELDDLAVTEQDHWLYGYDPRNGSSIPVDEANFYPNYITGDMQQIPGDGQPLGIYNRYVSVFGNLSYTWRDAYSFYGALRKDGTNIVGEATNRQWSPFWALGAGWELTRHRKRPSKILPLLKWRASYGCDGNIGDRVAYLQTQYLGLNVYNSPQSGIASPPDPNLTWEKTYLLNMGWDFALLQSDHFQHGRITGSLDLYLKWADHLLGNDTLPPSSGLPTFFGNTAAIHGNGADLVLNSNNLPGSFQWNTTLLLSWASDRVSRYLLQPQIPSAYVAGAYPMTGKSSTALFAYNWGGLDPNNGNPLGYLNGKLSTDYVSIMNDNGGEMRVRGSYLPELFGSLTNTFSWRGWSLSARLLMKAHYWFRRPSIDYNRLISGQYPGEKDYDLRWQAPGDEKRTSVPSFPAINDPNRDLFYQYSDVLITKGDQVRWQDLRLSYELGRRVVRKNYWRDATVYAYVSNPGILWRANRFGIDPDAASFGSMPAVRAYSLGMQIHF